VPLPRISLFFNQSRKRFFLERGVENNNDLFIPEQVILHISYETKHNKTTTPTMKFPSLSFNILAGCAMFWYSCNGQPLSRDATLHRHSDHYERQHERSTQVVTPEIIQITRLVLVNTDTGKDIMDITNGTEYDVAVTGVNITIRAETTDFNGCGWVVFDLDDGSLQHNDLNRPFSVAGNTTAGKFHPSKTLSMIGSHTLRVTPSADGSLMEVPPELEEFPIEERRKNFKSCWAIDEFTAVTVDGTLVAPENDTAIIVGDTLAPSAAPFSLVDPIPAITESSTTTTTTTTTSTLSSLLNYVSDSATSLSSLVGGGRRKRTLKTQSRRGQVSAFVAGPDGSAYVTFYVSNGPRTMAPTPAPKPSYDISGYSATAAGTMQGEFKVWNKLTLAFVGPSTAEFGSSERGPYGPLDTFKDFRTDVTFTHIGTGITFVVPGYFALDGNAANSIGKTQDGSVWLTHFVPNYPGDWSWSVSFRQGENCSPNGGGESAGYFDGVAGKFFVDVADPLEVMKDNDLRKKGKLQYVGRSQLMFAGSEEYYLKAGPESPENILAYSGFDNTPSSNGFVKSYSAHIADYVAGNPTWSNGNGTGIIGAMNYLASTGVNTISVTALTVDGPDGNVHPYNDPKVSKYSYDVSKMAQWEVVFDYAERLGMTIRFTFSDSETDDLLDNGETLEERKTFYREMIARFGHHLGLIWDLGEDISNVDEIIARSTYIKSIDPYSSPIMVQTPAIAQDSVYKSLYGQQSIDVVSASGSSASDVAAKTTEFMTASEAAGKPFVVSADGIETTAALWANIMSGGMGGQLYFGATDDLALQDFKTKSTLLTESALAIGFFAKYRIPFKEMKSTAGTGFVSLSDSSKTVVTYKYAGTATLSVALPGTSSYSVIWYDPLTGAATLGTSIVGAGALPVSIGAPPSSPDAAWVALIRAA
jgi:Domain of unknown function (DUF5060)